ncbi:hypothetical protein [uncultured Flavobacterium sp.]|uniref:hypothetical protein n=1 Tax=uncultured Flavobacterium sp. TaxID=165435 RepID=UPI002592DBDB|nr:hypothetical protein [uncultured Flavobacterium sp.]
MAKLDKIKINTTELSNLPLFFKRIHFNVVTHIDDENLLMKYNSIAQTKTMSFMDSSRYISKTVNFKILDENEK